MTEIREYRGHIRNWAALCRELRISGTLPREEREKEILAKAYETWGTQMGGHLYGMFAFALWDEEQEQLFCMRDHFGTKPFYYYVTEDGRLLAGTMIRQIMEQPGFVKELNRDMLQLYLTLTYTAGEDTFFKGVKKLMPGHYLIWKDGKLTVRRYWAPKFHPDETKTLEDWADEIHTTLRDIFPEVKEPSERAESFLSGGVDSSYVLAMSDVQMTDSCGYDDERFDESPLAAETARLLGRGNSRCRITPEDYFAIVPWVMRHMEQPLGDASAIAFAIACRETAKHTKLCYSGEGADEFFGGYNMYRNAERYGDNLKTFYVGNTNIMKEDEKKRILKYYNEDLLPIDLVKHIYEETEGLDPLTKMSDVDIRIWLEGDIYLNVDKMSTAAGLEIRMPLTDRRIFDIASRMPARFKVNAEQNKVAFRTAAAKVLPEEIAFRKKLGFIVPIRIWMADDRYNADVKATFCSLEAEQFFHVEEIRAILDDYLGGNSDAWRKVWTIYTFLVWYREYFDTDTKLQYDDGKPADKAVRKEIAMDNTFNTDQAKDILERGMVEARELVQDPSKVEELLRQTQDKLQTIPGVGDLFKNIPLTVSLVKSCVTGEYKGISPQVILPLVGAFAYLIKKKDLIRDNIPVLGYADDIAVLGLALKAIEPELKAYEAWQRGGMPTEASAPEEGTEEVPETEAAEEAGVIEVTEESGESEEAGEAED